jgi:hypothetical protein
MCIWHFRTLNQDKRGAGLRAAQNQYKEIPLHVDESMNKTFAQLIV